MTEQTTKVLPLHVPLSELTREKRRALLGVSVAEIAISTLKVLPSKISWLGIDFTEVHHQPLLLLMSLIVLYFLLAFVIHACSDFVAWSQARNQHALEVTARIDRYLRERRQRNGSRKETESPSDNEDQNEGDDDNAKDLLPLYRDKQVRISWLKVHVAAALDFFEFALPVFVGLYAVLLPWLPEVHQ